jgi:hypothetical protein
MKISPDLIPHARFHSGKWLQPVERPSWYYFQEKQNTNTISNAGFMQSVDEPLRDLVKFLHTKGIKTTPSCSGHHMAERDLEKIYHDLEKDGAAIRNGGLQLKDIETGQLYTYRDQHYALPWSRQHFLERVEAYQQKGVLGLRPGNRKKLKEQLLKLNVEGAHIREKDSVVFIFTDGERNIKAVWREITSQVKQLFRSWQSGDSS